MTARPRNAGTLEAPAGLPVTVRAGLGGPIVATLETTQPIAPGKTGELLFFEFAAEDLAQSQPRYGPLGRCRTGRPVARVSQPGALARLVARHRARRERGCVS